MEYSEPREMGGKGFSSLGFVDPLDPRNLKPVDESLGSFKVRK